MSKLRTSLTAIVNTEDINSTNYRIAHYLLEKNYIAKRISIEDVSSSCYCSKSTVSRFFREIGYADFEELNQDLYSSFEKGQRKFNRYFSKTVESEKNMFLSDLEQCIQSARTNIKVDDIKFLAESLAKYPQVGILGDVQSQTVAKMFQDDLGLAKKIVTVPLIAAQQQRFIEQADENTLILIISCSGRYLDHVFQTNTETKGTWFLLTTEQKMLRDKRCSKVICVQCNQNYACKPRILDIFLNIVAVEYANHWAN